jgi:hypothetical protein
MASKRRLALAHETMPALARAKGFRPLDSALFIEWRESAKNHCWSR